MAPPTGGKVFRDSLITFGATDYTNQVHKARFVPDTNVQTYKTLVPDGIVNDADTPTWTLELEGLQINTTGGLAKYIRDNAGTVVEVIIQDGSGSGKPQATADVLLVQVPFGGEQGEWLDIDVEFAVNGQPVFGTSA